MEMKKAGALLLASGCAWMILVQPVSARRYTIYQRQSILANRINRAEAHKELTFREAEHLRDDLRDIQDSKERMIARNNGRLSYKDETKLEAELNHVSALAQKWQLNKRVASK